MKNYPNFIEYAKAVGEAVETVDLEDFNAAKELIRNCKGIVYVAGNGGSAAIANHWCCDFMKNEVIKAVSLVSNTSVLTAYANDYGYRNVFAKQLQDLATDEDILILISSSGQSENIAEAVLAARAVNIPVIGISGFSKNNLLHTWCDYPIYVNSDNYGVVEDVHQMIMHSLAQSLRTETIFPISGAV